MITVLLADDELMVRSGVKAILSTQADIRVVAEAQNGQVAVELARLHRPTVALLDIRMPCLDGLATAALLRDDVPETRVGLLTTFSEDDLVARALDEGVPGFLLKAADPRDLIAGVRALAKGQTHLAPKVVERLITEVAGGRMARGIAARERIGGLTQREAQVLTLLVTGLSNSEIAERIGLTEGTIKAYVSTILLRLNVKNRVQAAILAYEAGLVGTSTDQRSGPLWRGDGA
ncbi:response regulator transcription factor [Micromonospora sp. NPDC048986]|uniref:response regulator transcription factor n=1 Tax=Micromonospora sp. NPDC048986 TaxID=3155644 RepID=UPI0033EABD6F